MKPSTRRAIITLTGLVLASILAGCAGTRRATEYDPQYAEDLRQQATAVLQEDPEEAERLLVEALRVNPDSGPAYNNLGVLYFQRGELHNAAEQFLEAKTLMPQHPRPYVNLGLVHYRAGDIRKAIEYFDTALQIRPNYIYAVMYRAHAQITSDAIDDTTLPALRVIALQGTNEDWRNFGREWALRLEEED
jgi:Tfp pilus assembly protein PilF